MTPPTTAQRIRRTVFGLLLAALAAVLLTKTEQPPWVGLAVLGLAAWLIAHTPVRDLFEMVKSYLPWRPKE